MPISTLPDLKSSTYMSNHDSSKSRLKWPYEEEDSWKPSSLNGSHYLTFKYPFDVIITGLVTQGNPLGKNNEWTRQFVFKYLDDALEQEITYSHEGNPVNFKGNTDRSSLKYNIFSNPIITREFTIQLTDWHNWPALRVQILGQPLSSYNYSQSIVKCYNVMDEIRKNTNSTPASTLDNCKVSCLQLDYPLCSFYKDNSTHCYCWNTLPSTYGTSENKTCNTNNRLLVYKTYDKLCPDPPTEYKATRNYVMPVPGLYTYKSTLTDTCIDGRFLDKNLTKSYTCLQDNSWSQDILMCEAFCDQLPSPLNAKANSSEDSVHTVIAVTCDHYFMTSHNDTLQYVTCNETGMWDLTLKHCDVYLCDETPTLLHASKYLKDSNTTEYMCDPYYSFSNGSQTKIITCDGNSLKWENLDDICTRQDDLICYRSMTSQFLGNAMRHTTNDVLLEFLPRSQMSCSSACLKDWQCKGYNYNDDVCRLFNSKSKSSADLTSDVTWSYFEKSDEDLYSCI
ncbi:uncharacterized protein [Mytilus edulis]|uniref:uncharacterized protein n=1 Tax=Mytilus edulis TaxID=6550 RepID=UPI0039F07BD1